MIGPIAVTPDWLSARRVPRSNGGTVGGGWTSSCASNPASSRHATFQLLLREEEEEGGEGWNSRRCVSGGSAGRGCA